MTDDEKTIESYRSMPEDWDSYGAKPIPGPVVDMARAVARIFHDLNAHLNPAPGGDGSVGFEICWPDGREFWVDVAQQPDGRVTMSAYIPEKMLFTTGKQE